ncbi:DUF4249 domain-containing protein [Larkinella soli]|uniref:DUF4249 domain-containing protein n=1 Tax=Larkinella soli TaxID=1770527 RepID=UPI000FFC6410|nr:DUF4249 domain-containing protein [Larkinella soli]
MKLTCILGLVVTLLAAGCQNMREEVAPGTFDQPATRLVLVGFLSPQDSLLVVKVNSTRPVGDANYTTNYGVVSKAVVTLSSGSRSIKLTYNGKQQAYMAPAKNFPIREGETYQIVAQTPDGLRASGRCTIPPSVALQRVQLDSVRESGASKYFVRYFWQDPGATANFYQTQGAFSYTAACAGCKTDAGARSQTASVVFESSDPLTSLLTDRNGQGRQLASYRGYLQGSNTSTAPLTGFSGLYEKAQVRAVLLNVEEAYYQYHRALALQKQADNNPFAEPVLLPTNIEGGLGCFAGYNQTTMKVTLK